MNKTTKRMTAAALCAALCLSGMGLAAAKTDGSAEAPAPAVTKLSADAGETQDASKEETVYVLAGADGSVQKIIVSDWLQNSGGSAALSDVSDLTDIENVKGSESYSINGEHMKVWDAQGNDIYYQGSIEKELPVSLRVSYMLDGAPISAAELAGKSGRVTIRFSYENRQYEFVTINGREEKIYVPFAMLTGLVLDGDTFRNVEVSNGKLINDGDRTIVIGLAFPGLQESLALSTETLSLPDYVEISADAEDFSLGTTITLAANSLFNDADPQKLGLPDNMSGSLSDLTSAMTQLTDGSSALYDGLCTLLDKSGELVSGVEQLAAGAQAIKEGVDSLDDGADQLKAGLSSLANGPDTLSSSSEDLNDGAAQVFNTLLSTASAQLEAAGLSLPALTIDNYADVLGGVIASLDESAVYDQAQHQVTAAVEERRPEIIALVTAAVREQVEAQVTAALREQVTARVNAAVEEEVSAQVIASAAGGLSRAEYDAAAAAGQIPAEQQAAIENAIAQQMASDAVQKTITETVDAQMNSSEIAASIAAGTDEQMRSDRVLALIAQNADVQVQQAIAEAMAADSVQAQLSAASEGAKSVISLKTSLDSYNAFYLGLLSYTGGVDSAAVGAADLSDGAAILKDGTAQLKVGAETLYNGVLTLRDGCPALLDGVTALRDGSMELSDGLQQLNDEGIQKISDLLGDDLDGLSARLQAVVDVSRRYQNFSGISAEMDGTVKFIYRTDEICVDDGTK